MSDSGSLVPRRQRLPSLQDDTSDHRRAEQLGQRSRVALAYSASMPSFGARRHRRMRGIHGDRTSSQAADAHEIATLSSTMLGSVSAVLLQSRDGLSSFELPSVVAEAVVVALHAALQQPPGAVPIARGAGRSRPSLEASPGPLRCDTPQAAPQVRAQQPTSAVASSRCARPGGGETAFLADVVSRIAIARAAGSIAAAEAAEQAAAEAAAERAAVATARRQRLVAAAAQRREAAKAAAAAAAEAEEARAAARVAAARRAAAEMAARWRSAQRRDAGESDALPAKLGQISPATKALCDAVTPETAEGARRRVTGLPPAHASSPQPPSPKGTGTRRRLKMPSPEGRSRMQAPMHTTARNSLQERPSCHTGKARRATAPTQGTHGEEFAGPRAGCGEAARAEAGRAEAGRAEAGRAEARAEARRAEARRAEARRAEARAATGAVAGSRMVEAAQEHTPPRPAKASEGANDGAVSARTQGMDPISAAGAPHAVTVAATTPSNTTCCSAKGVSSRAQKVTVQWGQSVVHREKSSRYVQW